MDIAWQFYHQGQSTFDGVEPAAMAVVWLVTAAIVLSCAERYPCKRSFSYRQTTLAMR